MSPEKRHEIHRHGGKAVAPRVDEGDILVLEILESLGVVKIGDPDAVARGLHRIGHPDAAACGADGLSALRVHFLVYTPVTRKHEVSPVRDEHPPRPSMPSRCCWESHLPLFTSTPGR